MPKIIRDERGTLRDGLFYEFFVRDGVRNVGKEDWVVAPLTPTDDELFIATDDKKDLWVYFADGLDLCGGARVSQFIPFVAEPHVVSPWDFASRLAQVGFSGLKLEKRIIEVNQSALKNPNLHNVWFTGRNCLRARSIVDGPNACPRCGYSPVICAECALDYIQCARCEFVFYVPADWHKGKGDLRLKAYFTINASPILEGRLWDGSDFIGCLHRNFISKRALDWLLATHAAPFQAQPARICTDGMTNEQLDQLETMAKSKP